MGSRHKARECAFQIIFQCDLSKQRPDEMIEDFWHQMSVPSDVRDFARGLALGTLQNVIEIDGVLSKFSENWKLHRMALVDRNILRMAVFELNNYPDIPVRVTLNEAIEIAKKFGTKDSSAFINGILDQVAKTVNKDVG